MNIIGMLDVPDSGEYVLGDRDVGTMTGDEQTMMRGKSI
jgi:ABC-type lipoprotein export system ATPase subunit